MRNLEVESASRMKLLGNNSLNGSGDAQQVVVKNCYAYVGHLGRSRIGTSILDVSDPQDMKLVSQIETPLGTHSHKVQVWDGFLFINYEKNSRESTGAWTAGLAVFDVSNPYRPRKVSFLETPGKGVHRMVYFGGDHLFMSASQDGFTDQILVVVNVAQPMSPRIVGRWWYPGMHVAAGEVPSWPESKRFAAHHAHRMGDSLLCSWWDAGFVELNISNPEKPELIASVSIPESEATHTAVPVGDGGTAVIVDEALEEDCNEIPKQIRLFRKQQGIWKFINSFPVPQGSFCARAGRFGPHNVHEPRPGSFLSSSVVIATYFNAGVRVYDIHNSADVTEIAHLLPVASEGASAFQANDLYVTTDKIVYFTDRAGGGIYSSLMDI